MKLFAAFEICILLAGVSPCFAGEPRYASARAKVVIEIKRGGWDIVILQQGWSSLPESRDLMIQRTMAFDQTIWSDATKSATDMVWLSKDRFDNFEHDRIYPATDTIGGMKVGHRLDFAFWIGEWDIDQKILQRDGNWKRLPAFTRVDDIGFAYVEHWSGQVQFFWEGMSEPEFMKALSVRSYNENEGVWQIHWMDSRNPQFELFEGAFERGVGTFYSISNEQNGRPLVRRITFSDIAPRSVKWELAISRDERKSWLPIWIMEMTKKN